MWVYLFAINVLFLKKKKKKKALSQSMAKSQRTPKPELYAALDGWWNIIHMHESMYELWICNQI